MQNEVTAARIPPSSLRAGTTIETDGQSGVVADLDGLEIGRDQHADAELEKEHSPQRGGDPEEDFNHVGDCSVFSQASFNERSRINAMVRSSSSHGRGRFVASPTER